MANEAYPERTCRVCGQKITIRAGRYAHCKAPKGGKHQAVPAGAGPFSRAADKGQASWG